jgi:CheY-like chemotaxis protein
MERRTVVLLAEDDPEQRSVLEELLEFEGYQPWVAGTPDEVLNQLARHPDAVLLDVGGVTSPAVGAALRQLPYRPAVLLVSGDCSLARVAQWLGADGYLTKPYDIDELLQALRRALACRASAKRLEPSLELAHA